MDPTTEETCTSTFVVPGDPPSAVRRCAGRPGHVGVFHGGDGAAWGPDAALDNRPAEPVLLKVSRLLEVIRYLQAANDQAADRFRTLISLHRRRNEGCRECGTVGDCQTAAILGVAGLDDPQVDAIIAGQPAGPAPATEEEQPS